MTDTIPIILAVEDLLGEVIAQVLLEDSGRKFAVGNCLGHKGFGYLKKNIGAFNKSARGIPILVLTDLDRGKCAPLLIADWLPNPKHNNLIFRVAVREIESWLLADRDSIAKFLGVSVSALPLNPDEILDPKALVINLAENSCRDRIRFLGWISDDYTKACCYNASLSLVMNSWQEGLPVVVCEAMSCGIPVLSSDVGAISELVLPNII